MRNTSRSYPATVIKSPPPIKYRVRRITRSSIPVIADTASDLNLAERKRLVFGAARFKMKCPRKIQSDFIRQTFLQFCRNQFPAVTLLRRLTASQTSTVLERPDSLLATRTLRRCLETTSGAKKFVKSLRHDQRNRLLSALHECAIGSDKKSIDASLADRLFNTADKQYPRGFLDREEFITAIREHRLIESSKKLRLSLAPVSSAGLFRLAVATGVPFIGFGFLDNLIMILAGESIEHMFGLTLGLSIMAAAACGNLISDVAGVCLADTVEATARKVFGLQAPSMSKFQKGTTPVRVSRMLGSAIGVSIGCLLGMAPLLFYKENKPIPEE